MYVYAKPRNRRGDISYERFVDAGCRAWYVDAREAEPKVRDLVLR